MANLREAHGAVQQSSDALAQLRKQHEDQAQDKTQYAEGVATAQTTAAYTIQMRYRAHREATALRALHAAHVAHLQEAHAALQHTGIALREATLAGAALAEMAAKATSIDASRRVELQTAYEKHAKDEATLQEAETTATLMAAASSIQTKYRSRREAAALRALHAAHAVQYTRVSAAAAKLEAQHSSATTTTSAAVHIQTSYRDRRARIALKQLHSAQSARLRDAQISEGRINKRIDMEVGLRRTIAAQRIQAAHQRKLMSQLAPAEMDEEGQRAMVLTAALRIQSRYRRHLHNSTVQYLDNELHEASTATLQAQTDSALTLDCLANTEAAACVQKWYRGVRMKRAVRSLHAAHVEQLRNQDEHARHKLEQLLARQNELHKQELLAARKQVETLLPRPPQPAEHGMYSKALANLHLERFENRAAVRIQTQFRIRRETVRASHRRAALQHEYEQSLRSLHAMHAAQLEDARAAVHSAEQQLAQHESSAAIDRAAVQIQARYRDHRARSALKSLHSAHMRVLEAMKVEAHSNDVVPALPDHNITAFAEQQHDIMERLRAAACIQKWYRRRREEQGLQRLHVAHVLKLRSTQAEWNHKLSQQACRYEEVKGEARRTAAAVYMQTCFRGYRAAQALRSLHSAHVVSDCRIALLQYARRQCLQPDLGLRVC